MKKEINSKKKGQSDLVFAFKRGSVNSDVMAGDTLEPIVSFKPTIKNILLNMLKPDNKKKQKKSLSLSDSTY